jgi:hypothetical protein
MALMQLIECQVALGGDSANIVARTPSRPVTYPELLMLSYVHGEDAVTDAYEVRREERDNGAEVDRLRRRFKASKVADVFPGARPRLPLADDRIRPRKAPSEPRRKPLPSKRDDPTPFDPPAEDGVS